MRYTALSLVNPVKTRASARVARGGKLPVARAVVLAGFVSAEALAASDPLCRAALPVVVEAIRHDTSPPLRSLPPIPPQALSDRLSPRPPFPNRAGRSTDPFSPALDPALSPEALADAGPMPPPLVSFEGVNNRNNKVPPDTNGDAGPAHYVQWVNLSLAVWDKRGNLLYGPVDGNTIWQGFGGICETHNNGDPIVLHDPLADRWVLSQLAFDWPHNFHHCVAVSATPDPTGAYHRYDFFFHDDVLNDYPKMGVWPDAYYVAVNQFLAETQEYRGQGALAYERSQMLVGGPARVVYFDLFAVNPAFGGALPSDLDGPLPPPEGSPAFFVEVDDDAWGWEADRLSLWRFHVDWADPSRSTFGVAGQPDAVLDLTAAGYAFDSDMCGYATACIPQPGGAKVDALSDRLMHRLAYRNLGDREVLTANHTVDVDGTDHAGIRWYEIRDPGGAPYVHQAGTFAPDADHRWMASVAMDGAGGIAAGYSVSSSTTYPSIRYAGRLASDPPGTLPRTEATLAAGTGFQTGASRWGDYSSMSVDPTDDCTFWYTQEYYTTTSGFTWQTRVGSFRFDSCRNCPLLGLPVLSVGKKPLGTRLEWSAAANAAAYDVVEGELGALRSTGGDFSSSVRSCLADGLEATSLDVEEADPPPGGAFWYLVRPVLGLCQGSYDEEAPSLAGSRDEELSAVAGSCP